MRRAGLWVMVAMMTLGLGYGVAALYRLRISRGDVFPEYSSLRADPLGTRALHDAAGLLPGRESVRWLRPPERLQAGAGDVVFVAGVRRTWDSDLDEEGWQALDRAAVAGARVVIAWRADTAQAGDAGRAREAREDPWLMPETKPEKQKKPDVETEKDTGEEDEKTSRDEKVAVPLHAEDYERRWGFRLLRRELVTRDDYADAVRAVDAPGEWPATLARWKSDLFFLTRAGEGWRVLYRRGGEPVMIERKRGVGSVTLLADSFLLSNEAVQRERATPVLAALLGNARRVVFVESHLGVEIQSGVAVLARRYGLGGAALTALVLAGLWIWRKSAPLAPIIPEDEEVRLKLAPTAGLEALLRRAVTPAKLFAACVEAWRPNAAAGDQRRLEASPTPGAGTDPVTAYNATTRTLSHKRIL
jgi:hypothetical protein